MTAIGNQARKAAGKAPIGDLNSGIYGAPSNKGTAHDVVAEAATAARRAATCTTTRSGTSTPTASSSRDAVPGYPTTAGYDLTTGWGVPQGGAWTTLVLSKP